MKYSKGETIAISAGEYSDYHIMGLFKVLVDFDTNEVLNNFLSGLGCTLDEVNSWKWQDDNNIDCPQKLFTAHLNSQGYIEDMDYREIHIGSYSQLVVTPWTN